MAKGGSQHKGAGTRIEGYEKREVQTHEINVVEHEQDDSKLNSRTSNLFHSNSLFLKENPYVQLANHFI